MAVCGRRWQEMAGGGRKWQKIAGDRGRWQEMAGGGGGGRRWGRRQEVAGDRGRREFGPVFPLRNGHTCKTSWVAGVNNCGSLKFAD